MLAPGDNAAVAPVPSASSLHARVRQRPRTGRSVLVVTLRATAGTFRLRLPLRVR